jgi:diguanylate cyclase (GGDEF)-like protein/PAS domain S-box-containing protein
LEWHNSKLSKYLVNIIERNCFSAACVGMGGYPDSLARLPGRSAFVSFTFKALTIVLILLFLPSADLSASNESTLSDAPWRVISLAALPLIALLAAVLIFLTTKTKRNQGMVESMRQSESRLRAILDSLPDRIWLKDRDGRYLVVNEAWCRYFDREADEVLGRTAAEIFSPELAEKFHDAETLVMVSDRAFTEEQCLTAHGGEQGWFDVFRAPMRDKNGIVTGSVGIAKDITDRKRTEEALRDSEDEYRGIFENSVVGLFRSTPQGGLLAVNHALAGIHGFASPEEMMAGVTDIGTQLYVSQEERRRYVETLCGHGEVKGFEAEQYRKDRSKIWVSLNTRVVHDAKGDIRYYQGIVEDITQRKLTEETLRESEERFRLLFASSADGILMSSQEGSILAANEAACRMFGRTEEELCRVGRAHLVDFSDPRAAASMERRQRTGLSRSEYFHFRKDGNRFLCEVVSTLFTNKSGQQRACTILRDVTEQRQADEELRWKTAFLEAQVASSLDGILVVDRSKKKILQNQRAIDLFSVPKSIVDDSDDEAERRWVANMTKDPDKFAEKVRRLYSHPDEVSRDEIELKDGRVVDRYTAPVIGHDGTYYGRIWVFRDISELRQNQKVLEQLSMTDGLTGISNRYRFDADLEREWRRAMRSHSPLSFILMDIDFFKAFNDNYGHLAGDDCLRRVAQSLSQAARRISDLVARYGGEEFAYLLPDTDAAGAVAVAQQIRKNMDDLNIPHPHSTVADRVTLSMGLATVIPAKGEASSDLIKLADDLLYKAKSNGRNQVRISLRD